MDTPIYNLKDYTDVYEPREDTFLFLDALESELNFIKNLKPTTVVEIGCGSGVVITAISKALKNNCASFSTDINIQACYATLHTSLLNDVYVECLNMNLLTGFKNGAFDMILFNPPYVVTTDEEVHGRGLNRAWAGGINGREIIDNVLDDLNRLLSKNGVCYMVILKENKPTEIKESMLLRGYKCVTVMERKIPGEHLFVLKFVK